MANAKHDSNRRPTAMGVSSVDGVTPVLIKVNPVTHAMLTESAAATVPTTITVANEATDTTCFPLFVTAATGDLGPKTNAGLAFNSSTAILTATGFSGPLTGNVTGNASGSSGSCTGNAATATALATPRAIYGNNFDGSAALTQVIASTYGGTGNGFTKFTGPTTAEKTFTLPDSSETLLYSGGALGTPSSGTLANCAGLPAAGYATMVGDSGAGGVKGAVPAPAAGDAAAGKFLKADGTWAAAGGGFSWGTSVSSGTGTGLAMTTADLAGDKPFITMAHTASGTLTSNSTVQFSIASSRTATGGTPSDNFDVATFSRTNITNGANLTAAGTVVKISGTDTQTANTLTPTYDLLQLNPSLRSTGSAVNIVVPSSVVTAPTNAYFNVTVGNTQTLTLTAGKIDTGTDASPGQIGLDIRNINGGSFNGSTPIAGLLVNSFASATQGLVDIAASVWLGKNYNTNSNFSIVNLLVDNTANAGAGANAGIVVRNAATDFAIPASTFAGEGAGIHVQQTGVGGTAYSLQTSANINSSTNGLVNYTLNNTQSGASIIQKIDSGSSAQAHSLYYATGSNASTSARAFNAAMATGWTGRLFSGSVNSVDKFTVDKDGAVLAASSITSGVASSVTGSLKLVGTTSGTVTFSVADAAGTWTMKLPTSAGSSSQFLQTDGSGNCTWATAGFTKQVFSTDFVATGRYGTTTVSGGTSSFDSSGLLLTSSATGTSAIRRKWDISNGNFDLSSSDPEFGCTAFVTTVPTTGDSFFGLGNVTANGTATVYTVDQMGFKIVYAASTATLSATNGNGTTETATDITSGVTVTNPNLYTAVKTSTTNVKFYVGATLKATHTTNLPDSGITGASFVVGNQATATNFELYVLASSIALKYA